jgi:hypothetical protein
MRPQRPLFSPNCCQPTCPIVETNGLVVLWTKTASQDNLSRPECSTMSGKPVTKERLVQVRRHIPGRHSSDELFPSERLTRYRATLKLLTICAEHGITPDKVTEYFQIA